MMITRLRASSRHGGAGWLSEFIRLLSGFAVESSLLLFPRIACCRIFPNHGGTWRFLKIFGSDPPRGTSLRGGGVAPEIKSHKNNTTLYPKLRFPASGKISL